MTIVIIYSVARKKVSRWRIVSKSYESRPIKLEYFVSQEQWYYAWPNQWLQVQSYGKSQNVLVLGGVCQFWVSFRLGDQRLREWNLRTRRHQNSSPCRNRQTCKSSQVKYKLLILRLQCTALRLQAHYRCPQDSYLVGWMFVTLFCCYFRLLFPS